MDCFIVHSYILVYHYSRLVVSKVSGRFPVVRQGRLSALTPVPFEPGYKPVVASSPQAPDVEESS